MKASGGVKTVDDLEMFLGAGCERIGTSSAIGLLKKARPGEKMYDLVIIGAGVTGCCIAREISKYEINACVIEKGDDVASGTSKANTGVIHTGLEADPGSLMAKLCVEGNRLMWELSEELDFPVKKTENSLSVPMRKTCQSFRSSWITPRKTAFRAAASSQGMKCCGLNLTSQSGLSPRSMRPPAV